MTTAADIIAELLTRKPALRMEPHTQLPYGWGLWLRNVPALRGPISDEKRQALTAELAGRAQTSPQPERELGNWKAFASLFQQQWHPADREERGLRWFGYVTTLLLHLLFAVWVAWLSWVHIPAPEAPVDEVRTRLEIVGDGTPGDAAGGQASPAPPTNTTTAKAAASAAASPTAAAVPPEQILSPAESEAAQSAEQALTISAPDVPTPQLSTPTLAQPSISVREREVLMIEAPAVQQVQPRAPATVPPPPRVEVQVRQREVDMPLAAPKVRALDTPAVTANPRTTRAPQVQEREVELAAERPQVPAVPAQEIAVRSRESKMPELRQREIAMPRIRPAASTTPSPSSEAAANPAAATAKAAATPSASVAAPSATVSASSPAAAVTAPSNTPKPGATPSTRRADDWGDARRNQAGTPSATPGSGLFGADGKPNLPSDALGSATTAPAAPGSRQAAARDEAAANDFLKRVPYPYEPTMFDKDWVPRESLLQEWVRKNIREVEVSIPGTSKKVRCVVSILQLGGGCSLGDGNKHDQPAVARPPPEIPIKRNPIKTDS